jgi:hypothetical protein
MGIGDIPIIYNFGTTGRPHSHTLKIYTSTKPQLETKADAEQNGTADFC